jgi:hypothetical protein
MSQLFPQKCDDKPGLEKTICLQAFYVCKPCKWLKMGVCRQKNGIGRQPGNYATGSTILVV